MVRKFSLAMLVRCCALTLAVMGLTCLANVNTSLAALVSTVSIDTTSQTFFPARDNDLIDNSKLGISLQGVSHVGYVGSLGSSAANLNDGSTGTASVTTVAFSSGPGGSPVIPWTSTYTFDTTIYDQGYTINEIFTSTGWAGSRSGQGYTIRYTTVSNPSLQLLGSFTAADGGGTRSSEIRIWENSTGIVLSGVKSIQFDVTNANNVYREFDVLGFGVQTPPAPEPSSVLLLGMGCVALMARRNRRRG